MRRNPHRVRRGRWGRDLDLGDLSEENWFWRHMMPFTDHFVVAVSVFLAYVAYSELSDGRWLWGLACAGFAVMNAWITRLRHRNRRLMREQAYLFNAWNAADGIDGQEGP